METNICRNEKYGDVRWLVVDNEILAVKADVFKILMLDQSGIAYQYVLQGNQDVVKVDINYGMTGTRKMLCLNEDLVAECASYSKLEDRAFRVGWIIRNVFHNSNETSTTPPEGYKLNPMYRENKSERVQLAVQPSLRMMMQEIANNKNISLNEFIHRTMLAEVTKESACSHKDNDETNQTTDIQNILESNIKTSVKKLLDNKVNSIIHKSIYEYFQDVDIEEKINHIAAAESEENIQEPETHEPETSRERLKQKIDKLANVMFGPDDPDRYKKAVHVFVKEYANVFRENLWYSIEEYKKETGKNLTTMGYLEEKGDLDKGHLIANRLLAKHSNKNQEVAS